MSDIVERLREDAARADYDADEILMTEAADEITRLRAMNAEILWAMTTLLSHLSRAKLTRSEMAAMDVARNQIRGFTRAEKENEG